MAQSMSTAQLLVWGAYFRLHQNEPQSWLRLIEIVLVLANRTCDLNDNDLLTEEKQGVSSRTMSKTDRQAHMK